MLSHSELFWLFLFLTSLKYISGNVYYIVPSQDTICPQDHCMTLSAFINSCNSHINSNTTLFIGGGNHSLNNGFSVSNVAKFSMLSVDKTNESSHNIICSQSSHFNLSNATHVNIEGLSFIGCGGNMIELVEQCTIQRSSFMGDKNSATSLTIIGSNVSLAETNFTSNQVGNYRNLDDRSVSNHQYISGGTVTVGGALIITNTTLHIDNCNFEGNTANIGGAIFSELYSNITIKNSNFTFNHAIVGQSEGCFGGALFIDETTKVIILDSNFENNTSDGDGGMAAVFKSMLSISHSNIHHNTATRYGGAVAIVQGSTLVSKGTSFYHNIANEGGGALHAEGNSLISVNNECTFVNNSAQHYGGVIHLCKSSAIFDNSMFKCNTGISGGVIYAKYKGNVTMNNSIISDNKADHHGGVVFLTEHSMYLISKSAIWHNQAEHGGVVYARELRNFVSISKSNFSFNTAGLNGGVLKLIYGGSVLINDSVFHNNSANREGGVLYALSMVNSQVYQSTFVANKANIGGVFTIRDGSKLFIQNSIFCGNIYSDLGAVIYADNKTENTIRNTKFVNNSGNYGGVLHATRNSNVTVDNCMFESNIANIDGGTLYGRASSTITVSDSLFSNNTAVNDAVVLAFDGNTIIMKNITFSDNKAGHDGGAVYVYDNSMLAITDCSFTGNKANNSGGAVYGRKNSNITIEQSIIIKCSAQNSGGGVYAQEDSNVTIRSSNLTYNSATTGAVLHVYIRSTANMISCNLSGNEAIQIGGVMNAYQFSIIQARLCTFDFNIGDLGGVSFIFQGSNLVLEYCWMHNNTAVLDGVIRVRERSSLSVIQSSFMHNSAASGGVVYIQDSNATIEATSFAFNSAKEKGGVIHANNCSVIHVFSSNFSYNMVENDGGVMALLGGTCIYVESSTFMSNKAHSNGGVIDIQESSNLKVINTTFSNTDAGSSGGVIHAVNSSVSVNSGYFSQNSATENGGIVDAHLSSSITILGSSFLENTVKKSGGIMYLEEKCSAIVAGSVFQQNKAENKGGIIAAITESMVNVTNSTCTHNSAENGGALSAEQKSSISFKNMFFNQSKDTTYTGGEVGITGNVAMYGGGIYLSESVLLIEIGTRFISNQANMSGGAVHADMKSSIMINSTVYFTSNRAISGYGGGINAQNTSGNTVDFVGNKAMFGGGISLANSKLYDTVDDGLIVYMNFISNRANYGGALYVDDVHDCSSSYPIGCFLQNVTKGLQLIFNNNSASSTTGGDNLFGGLLDRCIIFSDTNSSLLEQNSANQFKDLSNIQSFDTVYSQPVRLCLCQNGEPNCSKSVSSIQVKQGNGFIVGPIAAVDQVGHPLTATVISTFSESDLSSLPANQMMQQVGPHCSNLSYQVAFPSASRKYELNLHAKGPCDKRGISEFSIDVHVLNCLCARGFTRNILDPKCTCICDKVEPFSKYITACDASTESVIRKGRFWITYLNDSSSDLYFVYPYCPLDYCQPPSKSISINLNLANGSDAQCANNRGGTLCGSCLPDYSLSLGSSKCIKCPTYWHGLLVGIIIVAILAGVIFVVLLLVLNLTVAIGTLNSIIFYTNIIYANRTIYFQQLPLTFIPVIVSWLNLDIGFNTCFYNRMDTYTRTWLQLAFPMYIIFLVIIIIWISSCSSRFSYLLGKRNPVATLATLILLSYTKLLETVVESLSFIKLEYPNYTSVNWLPDPNLEYGKGKHIALIIAAVFILILGLIYTILITSWQWLLQSSRLKLFRWTKNQKLHIFIGTYHIPHTAKHRYWTGLLLLVRVIVYLIATVSVSIDPQITLLSTAVIMSCLLSYKTILMIRVYRNWLLNAMESYVYFNISIFAMVTWYTFGNSESQNTDILQTVAAYLSAGTIFIIFVLVIAFHLYRYGSTKVYSMGQNSKLGKRLQAQIISYNEEHNHHTPLDNTLFDILDSPPKIRLYVPPTDSKQPPTRSEVSMTESESLECPQSQAEAQPESVHETQQWQNIQDDNVRGSKRSKSLFETPNFMKRFTAAEVSCESRPMLLSYRTKGSSNKSIIEPLLKEDRL